VEEQVAELGLFAEVKRGEKKLKMGTQTCQGGQEDWQMRQVEEVGEQVRLGEMEAQVEKQVQSRLGE